MPLSLCAADRLPLLLWPCLRCPLDMSVGWACGRVGTLAPTAFPLSAICVCAAERLATGHLHLPLLLWPLRCPLDMSVGWVGVWACGHISSYNLAAIWYLLSVCACAAERLATGHWPPAPAPVAMAVEVSVGYVRRWAVGGWACGGGHISTYSLAAIRYAAICYAAICYLCVQLATCPCCCYGR
jgi:hypothetical protein